MSMSRPATDTDTPDPLALLRQRTEACRCFRDLARRSQETLDAKGFEALAPLLDERERIIAEIQGLDQDLKRTDPPRGPARVEATLLISEMRSLLEECRELDRDVVPALDKLNQEAGRALDGLAAASRTSRAYNTAQETALPHRLDTRR